MSRSHRARLLRFGFIECRRRAATGSGAACRPSGWSSAACSSSSTARWSCRSCARSRRACRRAAPDRSGARGVTVAASGVGFLQARRRRSSPRRSRARRHEARASSAADGMRGMISLRADGDARRRPQIVRFGEIGAADLQLPGDRRQRLAALDGVQLHRVQLAGRRCRQVLRGPDRPCPPAP